VLHLVLVLGLFLEFAAVATLNQAFSGRTFSLHEMFTAQVSAVGTICVINEAARPGEENTRPGLTTHAE
jgi:hypothetical protein